MCIKTVKDITIEDVPLKKPRDISKLIKSVKIEDNGENLIYKEDTLAKTTRYTKITFDALNGFYKWFQNSDYYKILFGTTQPAHFVTVLAVIVIAFLLYPTETNQNGSRFSPLWMLIYLASFSMHFGTQIWMTFVSGLSLYFNIPRHTFGSIQQVLFPRYFLINAIYSFVTLAVFLTLKKAEMKDLYVALQVFSLTLCFLIELLIRLYMTSPLLHLICVKTQLEKAAGIGMEIGRLNPGTLMDCPYYLKIHRTFRKTHVTIAIGNIICMGCTFFHLYYLSQKICNL